MFKGGFEKVASNTTILRGTLKFANKITIFRGSFK
jgi:hypothetical protein